MPGLGNLEESQAHRSFERASSGPWGAQGLKEHPRTRGKGLWVQPTPLCGGSRILLQRKAVK